MSHDDAPAPRPQGTPVDQPAVHAPVPSRQVPAPARSRRTARRPTATAPTRDSRRTWVRGVGPAVVSAALHVVVLLALAMLFIATERKPDPVFIESGSARDEIVADAAPVEFDAEVAPPDETEPAEPAPAEIPTLDVASLAPEAAALDTLAASADAPPADLADASMPAATDLLAAIGGDGEAAPGAAGGSGGAPKGRGSAAPSFFGKSGKGRSVCFVCDNSNSYRDGGFHMVLAEVAQAINTLKPDQSFFVIFFSDAAYPMFHPDPVDALQPATPQNKQRLQAWLGTVEMCVGGQGIGDAVKLATTLGADVVYFLSDGEHSDSVVRRMVAADFGDTSVHTFGMQQNVADRRTGMLDPKKVGEQQARNQTLIDIASAHGGDFTPVMVPPEAAAMEQVRPIRKNRSRGSVWGTRLPATEGN